MPDSLQRLSKRYFDLLRRYQGNPLRADLVRIAFLAVPSILLAAAISVLVLLISLAGHLMFDTSEVVVFDSLDFQESLVRGLITFWVMMLVPNVLFIVVLAVLRIIDFVVKKIRGKHESKRGRS